MASEKTEGKTAAALRRRRVASMLLRGMEEHEIVEALPNGKNGLLNPATNEPWSQVTVSRDVKGLLSQWQKEAAGDFAEMKARHLAENREMRRAAWSHGNLPIIALIHEQRGTGILRSSWDNLTSASRCVRC